MKTNRLFISWLLASACICAHAQQTAIKAFADGHYHGARQQLVEYLEKTTVNEDNKRDAEALILICDYVTNVAGTADSMEEWLENARTSQYAEAISMLRRNLLIKEQRFDEALQLFFANEGKSPISTPLAYPLTRMSEEMSSFNEAMYRLAGEHLYDKAQWQKAATYLEAGEKTRTALYKLGMCYYNQGAFDKARANLIKAAENANDEMAQNAWLHTGIASLRLIKKTDAQTAFMNAAQMNASKSLKEMAMYNYALTLHEQNSPQTVKVMEDFLNEFPTSQYATPVSQCLTAAYMSKKDYNKALQAISKVQAQNTDAQNDKQTVLYNLAFQELNSGRIEQALAYAGEAVALGNKNAETYAEAYYIKGDCNYRQGNYSQAANDLNTAINLGGQTANGKLKNNTYAIYSLGYALYKQQKYNAAINQFSKVTTASDASASMKADAFNRQGDSYLNMRNYDEADKAYAQAKATDHNLGDYSMLQQAYIEGLRGNYGRKVEILDKLRGEYTLSSLTAKALFEQGRAYVLSGKTDEATTIFQSIVVRFPGNEYAQKAQDELSNLATNIAIQDSIAAVQDSIENAAAMAPVMAAQALFEANNYQAAEQQLNAAIDKGIGRPYWLARAFVLLSDIYKAEGRAIEAKQTLESLKANYKEDDDIKKMIEERMK